MAVVLILGAAIVAAIMLVRGGEEPTTNTSAVATVPTGGSAPAEPPAADPSAPSDPGTTATIPGYDPGGTEPPGGQADAAAYRAALTTLDETLVRADQRIPQLATQINNTAPDVPQSVYDELADLQDEVEGARTDLGGYQPPLEFQEADSLIFEATDAQQYRIDQTMQGIEAMWAVGTVEAAGGYFDEGRAARDDFRRLYDQYLRALP